MFHVEQFRTLVLFLRLVQTIQTFFVILKPPMGGSGQFLSELSCYAVACEKFHNVI